MGPEFGPVFGASEYWHISRGLRKRSHFGACILVLANHFRAHFVFGIAQSGRGATISSATCSRRTPKCSQLMLALNTYSFQTIKLKLAAFLPSAAPTGEALCGAHVFEGFFGLENGPVKSENPPRHSRRSVSDGVIQLRVPLAGRTSFFLQAPISRRILTKMSGAICCMNMRFAKRSWEHPCF